MKQNEKNRELSQAEKKRLDEFNNLCEELDKKGFTKNDQTFGIVGANVFSIVMLVIAAAAGILLFILNNGHFRFESLLKISSYLIFFFFFLVLTVVHELIHGLFWGIFAQNHFKDISFGFMKEYLTPYCNCKTPLKKSEYVIGSLMPLIILGFGITALSIIIGSEALLLLGVIMISGAAGDVIASYRIVKYKKQKSEMLIMDHPTQVGFVVFEK